MSLFVLDTDHLTLYYHGDPIVVRRVDAQPSTLLTISVITVDEQLAGWYTLARRARRPDEVARAKVISVTRWYVWRDGASSPTPSRQSPGSHNSRPSG
jgi:hypothetical protein